MTNAVDEVLRGALSEPRHHRTLGALVAVPAWAVLGIAAWLTPAPQGYGTHQQLGLGACTMLSVTGWPCPMCGMTTTFALLAHGRVVEALKNQPFGPVLFAITLALAIGGLLDAVTGRGVLHAVTQRALRHERVVAIGLLMGMGLGWMYKCVRMHPEIFGL